MSIQTLQPKDLPKTYDGLMKEHMIRPIHDSVSYNNACGVLDALSGLDLNAEQAEYLEALSIFVEAYEQDQRNSAPSVSGRDALCYLCEENGISGGKLAEILNVSRPLGVKLLSGERKLTVSHIARLADYFRVSPGLFMAKK
jgi:HTH-type transcriptional regulator / antitoxin HigA